MSTPSDPYTHVKQENSIQYQACDCAKVHILDKDVVICKDQEQSEHYVDNGQAAIVSDIFQGASPTGPPNGYFFIGKTIWYLVSLYRWIDREISFVPLSLQPLKVAES